MSIIRIIKSTTTTDSGRPKKIYEQLKKDPEERKSRISMGSSISMLDVVEDAKTIVPKTMRILHRQPEEIDQIVSAQSTNHKNPIQAGGDMIEVDNDFNNERKGRDSILRANDVGNGNKKVIEETKEVRISIPEQSPSKTTSKISSIMLNRKRSQKEVMKKVPKRKVDPEVLKLVSIIKEATTGKEWSKVINEKNVTIYKKAIPNCPVILIKGVALLEGIPFDTMWKAIADTSLRKTWEKLFLNFESIEENPDGTEIIYFNMKSPFPVQDRDFLQRKTVLHDYPEKGQVLLHFVSIENDKKPPLRKYVRTNTIVAGYLIKELSKFPLRCSISLVNQVDLKGSIPKSLINMFSASGSRDWVNSFRDGCASLLAKKNGMK